MCHYGKFKDKIYENISTPLRVQCYLNNKRAQYFILTSILLSAMQSYQIKLSPYNCDKENHM